MFCLPCEGPISVFHTFIILLLCAIRLIFKGKFYNKILPSWGHVIRRWFQQRLGFFAEGWFELSGVFSSMLLPTNEELMASVVALSPKPINYSFQPMDKKKHKNFIKIGLGLKVCLILNLSSCRCKKYEIPFSNKGPR